MALKLLFAANVPVWGHRYNRETRSWEPHIYHKDLHIKLCEVCGSQLVDRRRSRTCSNRCTEIYWRRVREAERNDNCRPYFWNIFRDEALKRDGHRCTQCGSKDDLEVHHRVPIAAGGTNAEDNLTTLCHTCHVAIHAEERRAHAEERRAAVEQIRVQTTRALHGGKTIEEW